MLSAEVVSTTSEHLKYIILGLDVYFSPVNAMSKQKRAMRHIIRKPHGLKVIHYAARMIYFNTYLSVFRGAKASEKICDTELK